MIIPTKSRIVKKLSLMKLGLVIFGLMPIIFALGLIIGKKGFRGPWQVLTQQLNQFRVTTYHRLLTPPPDKININIAFVDLQKIERKRLEALEQGVLITSDEDFVTATIDYRNQKIPVKLRLKGDWTDHLEGDKWSFRIDVKDNNSFMGMRYFSIQDPATRGQANEWLFLQAIKKEGLIALRFELIDVSINGDHKGIYALEEHFSKELLENNQRREAPILKFSETQFWENGVNYGFTPESSGGLFYQSLIEPFRLSKTLADSKLLSQFQQAEFLLRGYRSGSLAAETVFDLEQWATFFALADIFGVRHGLVWHNLRFYPNPLTGLIEPIAFDAGAGERITYLSLDAPQESYEMTGILKEPVFQKAYLKKLRLFSAPEYLADFLKVTRADLDRFVQILRRESLYELPTANFYANQDFGRRKLAATPAVRAFVTDSRQLEIFSTQELPLEVTSVKDGQGRVVFNPSRPLFISPASHRKTMAPVILRLETTATPPLTITYNFLGSEESDQIQTESWTIQTRSARFAQRSNFPTFLKFDMANRRYLIPPGNWNLTTDLVIGRGYSLFIAPGTKLNLTKKAGIVSHSPVNFEGIEGQPIKIYSSDGSGQGLLVLDAEQKSNISYTVFENLSFIDTSGTNVTGAVTFYKSPVKVAHTSFVNNQAEDSLNIINTSFEITTTGFDRAGGDALDVDFGDGEITDSHFTKPANDAVDLSVSRVTIKNVTITGAGDKGISAGESSRVVLQDSTISASRTGVASKDLSYVEIKLLTISDSQFGLSVYQKKPEFGPASIYAWGLGLSNIQVPFVVETGSRITRNDVVLPDNYQNVAVSLYGE